MITELLPSGGLILCAVSGGADSMFLLEYLRALGYAAAAAHFDHGLRGQASQADADFVRDYCAGRGIPCVSEAGDTDAYASAHRLGTEEAARILRYDFLERAADSLDAAVIATAHTADDNAETVLMRLTRGAGAKGLGGIPPIRGRIVRPMLDVTRDEVVSWLREHSIPWREDESNAGDDYMRNRVRHHVIPALKKENPAFLAAVGRTARLLREDEAFLDGLAAEFIAENLCGDTLPADRLAALPRPVASRVIRRLAGDIPLEQTESVLSAARTGGVAEVPGLRAETSCGLLRLNGVSLPALPERIVSEGELPLPEAGLVLRCEKVESCPAVVHKSFNTFFFSCENIYGTITVAARRPGDAYRPTGRGCTKTLKSLFTEKRVPVWARDQVPVLRDGRGILGVMGMPPDERCAAQPGDRDVVRIEFLSDPLLRDKPYRRVDLEEQNGDA